MATRVYGGEIFSQIKVSGQPDVDADSDIDALTLIAGSNITLTTDATNDTVTISTTGLANQTHTGDATGATALTVVGINNILLSGLATGILKNTTTTGVPSIAVAGDFPTLNQNTTGTASNVTGIVALVNGGTGANTASGARINLAAAASGANADITSLTPGGLFTLNQADSNTIRIASADAGVTGVSIDLFHNSASPAIGDVASQIQTSGKRSDGGTYWMGLIRCEWTDPAVAIGTSKYVFHTRNESVGNTMTLDHFGKLSFGTIGDSSAAPGNATLNTVSGKSAIAAGASACTITNAVVTATSLIFVTALDNDATLVNFKAVPGAGSFVITGNANATATWKFQWWIIN